MWGPSRHLGSLTAANWVSFDFNVAYSSCWGYSLINTLKLKKSNCSGRERSTQGLDESCLGWMRIFFLCMWRWIAFRSLLCCFPLRRLNAGECRMRHRQCEGSITRLFGCLWCEKLFRKHSHRLSTVISVWCCILPRPFVSLCHHSKYVINDV